MAAITYGKTALMMLTLESLIGEKTVMHGLHDYFDRYKFKHPTPAEFTASMNEAVGQNLDWYWKQAIYGTETLDDRILSAGSERLDWYNKDGGEEGRHGLSQRGGGAPARHLRPAGAAGGEVRRWLDRARELGRQGPLASLYMGPQGETGLGGGRSRSRLLAGSRSVQQQLDGEGRSQGHRQTGRILDTADAMAGTSTELAGLAREMR